MQRLSVFLFTNILGKKMYDEFDDVLGELKDIYVTTEQGYPRVIGYKVKRDGINSLWVQKYNVLQCGQ